MSKLGVVLFMHKIDNRNLRKVTRVHKKGLSVSILKKYGNRWFTLYHFEKHLNKEKVSYG